MFNRMLLFLFGGIAVTGLAFGLIAFYRIPRIVYARSYDLVDKYEGTQEARKIFEAKKSAWQANIDSLTFGLRAAAGRFDIESRSMSEATKRDTREFLAGKERELFNYTQAIESKAQEEDNKMMQSVLNQVNSYVEEYGKKHGYDVILGTSTSGSVLFARKELDVTDEILKGLNESYRGKK